MKQVILNSLTLCNFKGEHNRTTTFNADITTISGANGLGKSRHFDAFLWLLFGKDKENRADYEIKTHDANGNVAPHIDVVVTGELTVNGESIKLTRKLVENWVTPKMSNESVFKGNETKCLWNDVPVSVTEYGKRVSAIVDEQLFKMITNPMFFTSLNWKNQREQLFAMAGNIGDDDIAANNADFRALLDKLTGKSFDDYKAEIAAKKRALRKELSEIQPRIDQTERMKPESYDWNALAKELESVNADIAKLEDAIAELNRALTDKNAAANAKFEETRQLRRDLMHCASRMDAIVNDANRKEEQRVFAANKGITALDMELENRKSALSYREKRIPTAMLQLDAIDALIRKLNEQRESKRTEWFDVDGRQFVGVDKCPTCGQPIPESMREESRAKFAEAKRNDLENITAEGKRLTKRIDALVKEKASHNEQVETWRNEIETITGEIAELESKIAASHEESAKEIDPNTIPEWVDAKRVYTELTAKIAESEKTNGDDVDKTEIESKIADKKSEMTGLDAKRDELMSKINHRAMIERADKEIESLNESGRTLAQAIADIERDEYTIGQFTKAKVDLVESRVARLFKNVKFKMFDYTIEGNAIETCVAMVNGVPFPTANSAAKINAGLDIINALCKYYDVTAPIFIDNRESVNQLIPTASQIVNLVVTNDPELIIS